MTKKILIAVLSSELGPYPALRAASKETWDAEPGGMQTIYYTSQPCPAEGALMGLPVPDGLYEMGRKDLAAFERLLVMEGWDFLARINSSHYVSKRLLKQFVDKLPMRDFIGGVGAPGENGRSPYLWGGGGYVISRDVVMNIWNQREKWHHLLMEDVALSDIAGKIGYPLANVGGAVSINWRPATENWLAISYHGATQGGFEFNTFEEFAEKNTSHFIRVKQDGDRQRDVFIMKELKRCGV